MRNLVKLEDHSILSEFKENTNQLKGKTISAVLVAEDEADYYEIRFTDGTGARVDVHCDKFCEGAPVARATIVFLTNVKCPPTGAAEKAEEPRRESLWPVDA
jgi:hypothetical protein